MEPLFTTDTLAPQRRGSAWRAFIEAAFGGMRVLDLGPAVVAQARAAPLASGCAFGIESSTLVARQDPSLRTPRAFYVALMERGACHVSHAGRDQCIEAGQFTLVDGAHPVQFSLKGELTLIQLPRERVLARVPRLERAIGRVSAGSAGDLHLVRSVQSLACTSASLPPDERAIAEEALLTLLPIASTFRLEQGDARQHRLARALALLDARACDAAFDAQSLAARLHVSRRHLDQLFATMGTTVTREIWERRLQRACGDLRSPVHAEWTVLEIALRAGFSDGAHFTRMFRRRFGRTPSSMRQHP